jgi:hypothetical protein
VLESKAIYNNNVANLVDIGVESLASQTVTGDPTTYQQSFTARTSEP